MLLKFPQLSHPITPNILICTSNFQLIERSLQFPVRKCTKFSVTFWTWLFHGFDPSNTGFTEDMATVSLLRLTEYLLTDGAFSLKNFWRRVHKLTVIATKFWGRWSFA